MNDRQEQLLIATAVLGADIKDFVRHPGYKILQKFISDKVIDARNSWLKAATPQDAEMLRIKAQPYAEIEEYLRKLIIEGAVAESNLNQARQDNLQ